MDAIVKARVESETKDAAVAVLKEMGLNLSDLLRMAVIQTAKNKRLPFDITLGEESLAAIKQVEAGEAIRASHVVDDDFPVGAPFAKNTKK